MKRAVNKKTKKFRSIRSILFVILLTLLYGCASKAKQQLKEDPNKNTFLPPQVTILSNLSYNNRPKVVLLKEAPKPTFINVPAKPGSLSIQQFTNDIKKIQVLPYVEYPFIDTNTSLMVSVDAIGKGLFTNYTANDGLAIDNILCSLMDKKGNIWFGTNGGGVSKYDGKSFTNYSEQFGLVSNTVRGITEDKRGNLWFDTDKGISVYNGKSFTNFTQANGLASNDVTCSAEDKQGDLWFGTNGGGVSKYDGKSFTNYTVTQGLINNTIFSISAEKSGNLWFGTDGGASKFDGQGFTNYTTAQGLPSNYIWSTAIDNSGNIWFGTALGGVSKYDGKSFTNYSVAQGLASNKIHAIMQDKAGHLWFGTSKGVSKLESSGFTNYTTAQGLADNSIWSITEDESGDIWFGTYENGISKYAGRSFISYTKAQGLNSNGVWGIMEDKDSNIWFGTDGGGAVKCDGKSFSKYTLLQGLAGNDVFCIYKDKADNLWFSTNRGVSKYDGKSFTNYTKTAGLPEHSIFCITEDKKGNLWLGGDDGAIKYDGRSFTNFKKVQGLANDVIHCVASDHAGNIWFGGNDGVSKFDGKRFTNYTKAQGLGDNTVSFITEDTAGDLWFATANGLSRLRKATDDRMPGDPEQNLVSKGNLFETFTRADGLPDNVVTQVLQENDHKLYIGTNQGICELLKADSANDGKKSWNVGKIFNSSTGYPVKKVNASAGSMYKDSKGIIWIGTGSATGLIRFDPKAVLKVNSKPPNLVIHSVKINNENICWSDLASKQAEQMRDSNNKVYYNIEELNIFGRMLSDNERDSLRQKYNDITFDSITSWYPVPTNLVLPHKNNNITFNFNAVETERNFLVKYQYKLEGYDNEWSQPSGMGSAGFANMFEGTYTFLLKAQSPDGIWTQPVSFSFKVLPPWWRNWWMYVLYITLMISLLAVIVWWNSRRLIAQKKKLENKVALATKQIRDEKEKVEGQKRKIEDTLAELKSTQSQLIQSEKMASLGELTTGIAHEIQNPLNFVNNFSEVNKELIDEMQQEMDKGNYTDAKEISNDIKDNQEKINHHGKRADAIVKSMLQHSQSSSGIKEPTNINVLADKYLKLAYHGMKAKDKSYNATLQTAFDENTGNINIIPQDIGRVLLNLYNNAFYAVNEKKKQQTDNYEPTVSVTTKTLNGKVEIKVKDNGNGIPQKLLDKIFQPFFTTKPTGQGTGLGLSLSYDIITKGHSGELKVETKEGEGSTFIIALPV